MRMAAIAVATVALLAVAAIGQEAEEKPPPPSPFNGWGEKEIAAHRKNAKSALKLIARRWMDARDEIVIRCARCQGTGKTVVHQVVQPGRRCLF